MYDQHKGETWTLEKPKILAFATQGAGRDDETRLRALLGNFQAEFYPFQQSEKIKSGLGLYRRIKALKPDLVVMEGTGIAGGTAVILNSVLRNIPYVLSSGDAIGPFIAAQYPLLGPFFKLYEKILTRCASGFIGWTPYLSGRAITFGCKKVMTASGWAPQILSLEDLKSHREKTRKALGISENDIVVGIVGSLAWNSRVGYCYGYELVRAYPKRQDLKILIVGEGSGRAHLEKLAGNSQNIIFTGKVPRENVPHYLAAMDVASLPQSVDQVGSFRYSTKLTEYMAVALPMIIGQVPMSYDLFGNIPGDWMWRMPGDSPWSETYIQALRKLLESLNKAEIQKKQVPRSLPEFEKEFQVRRVTEFIQDLYKGMN